MCVCLKKIEEKRRRREKRRRKQEKKRRRKKEEEKRESMKNRNIFVRLTVVSKYQIFDPKKQKDFVPDTPDVDI